MVSNRIDPTQVTPIDDGCENPTCDIHGNGAEKSVETFDDPKHVCTDECPPGPSHAVEQVDGGLYAVPEADLERAIAAIDQHYHTEDLGYAGDARVLNLRDQRTGEYLMTIMLTHTP